ncbi:TIGR03089 family protein [Paraoerskovia marina]|uniref:TIGR03089 family protein n=1 Tax=Paraoerskovia marina TaxID=545619 RepID=A0A1H1QTL7_9CELL|nr:TIGR03089 family protein [Paraoerskovia marina]SDS26838.1 TIGR03089 family protein [Paraoerskovia marina]
MTTPLPPHITDLLVRLRTRAGRPCVTWYGDGGERVELSAAVVENWVTKTTNLLVEEFDASSSCVIAIDVIPHWRSLVWSLAAWRTGAEVVEGDTGDVVVTTSPATVSGRDVVAVALPALARSFDGELPASAVDAASAVMTYGDQLGWAPPVDPDAPAVTAPRRITHGEIVAAADDAATGVPAGARALLEAPDTGLVPWLLCVVGVLVRDGSLVLASTSVAAELRADPDRRARLVATERVDADLLG